MELPSVLWLLIFRCHGNPFGFLSVCKSWLHFLESGQAHFFLRDLYLSGWKHKEVEEPEKEKAGLSWLQKCQRYGSWEKEVTDPTLPFFILEHGADVWRVALCNSWLATSGNYGTIQICNLEDYFEKAQLDCTLIPAHHDQIGGLAFLDSADRLVSGADDTLVRFWDRPTKRCLGTVTDVHSHYIWTMESMAQGTQCISGSADGYASLFDVEAMKRILFLSHGVRNTVYCTSSQNSLVASGVFTGCVFAWDLRTPKVPVAIVKAHTMSVKGIDLFKHQLITASLDGRVGLFDVRKMVDSPLALYNAKMEMQAMTRCRDIYIGKVNGQIDRLRPEFQEENSSGSRELDPSFQVLTNRMDETKSYSLQLTSLGQIQSSHSGQIIRSLDMNDQFLVSSDSRGKVVIRCSSSPSTLNKKFY
jgi:hypothetical protein